MDPGAQRPSLCSQTSPRTSKDSSLIKKYIENEVLFLTLIDIPVRSAWLFTK